MKHIKRAMLTALAITTLLGLNTISSIDLAHAKELKFIFILMILPQYFQFARILEWLLAKKLMT